MSQDVTLWSSDRGGRFSVVERTLTAEGRSWRQPVIVQGRGAAGAVMCATAAEGVLMVDVWRPVVGLRVLELPRGWIDACDEQGAAEEWAVTAAVRECEEETGALVAEAAFVGWMAPDSGLLASRVGIVSGRIAGWGTRTDPAAGTAHIVSPRELRTAIADGRCCDGMTLAALAMSGCLR